MPVKAGDRALTVPYAHRIADSLSMDRTLPLHVALLLGLTALAVSAAPAAEPDGARQRALVHLVRQDCGSCHGMTLKGGLGVALLPEDLKDKDVEGLAAIILDGIPNTPMPPWRGLLTEADARWIADQLKKGFPQ